MVFPTTYFSWAYKFHMSNSAPEFTLVSPICFPTRERAGGAANVDAWFLFLYFSELLMA